MEDIKTAQHSDPDISMMWLWVQSEQRLMAQNVASADLKFLCGQFQCLRIADGILVRILELASRSTLKQIVVPKTLREEILGECHSVRTGEHFGVDKTMANLKRKFLWYGMREHGYFTSFLAIVQRHISLFITHYSRHQYSVRVLKFVYVLVNSVHTVHWTDGFLCQFDR
ncbi:hypothetical protein CAPTEDRAFT_193190 [Capitella teleta]|uniref:Integrase zinc-binding domain-containing protein n=1 Tax=Capitella teleta TaxID=283909 RepID=R7UWN2_CAPTE|nr:hypothetical protein CAPTEDRAFT_193190 [Capitella teleta]|eukprot:ELU07816.1 hypothetical protein CAPTEDRAFT_193190 [Capitella teleta]